MSIPTVYCIDASSRKESRKVEETRTRTTGFIRRLVMNRLAHSTMIAAVVVIGFCLLVTQSMGSEYVCKSKGKIEVIDCDRGTVAVEVLMGDTYSSVIGPLRPNAIVKIGGQVAKLEDFSVGDEVTVRWIRTNKQDVIEALEAP
jgi:hypothetical protein